MTMINGLPELKKKLVDIFSKSRQVAIAGHTKPDGDCIGACLALGLALKGAGKDVYVLLEDFPPKFECIPGIELLYSGDTRSLNPDLFIACDCADKDRIGKGAAELLDRANMTVCIDHHSTNIGFADCNIIDGGISSTCELIYNTIFDILSMSRDIETAICAGILYDTGGLRFESAKYETFQLISDMLSRNIPVIKLFNSLIYEHSLTESKALAKVIEHISMIDGYPVLTSYISRNELLEIDASSKDLDGIVEYLSGTRGADVTVFAYERAENNVKVSLRSKGLNVGELATKMGGGGHILAAGFECTGDIKTTLVKATEMIKESLN